MKENLKKVLWLVLARSGSKGVPHKNIRKLGDMPLLAIRINNAKQFGQVYLSTDSEEYAKIGKNFGAIVENLRPKHLATDSASSIDVIIDFLKNIKSKLPEYICLLEPSSPFVSSKDLYEAFKTLVLHPQANYIVSVKKTSPHPLFIQDNDKWLKQIAINLGERAHNGRQTFKEQITPSGGLYFAKTKALLEDKTFYTDKTLSFMLDDISSIEIDSELNFMWAEFIISKGIINLKDIHHKITF